MTHQDELEIIYRTKAPDDIPWNREGPPPALIEAIERHKIRPCKAIDLGCGTGNSALHLAGRGFDVTGIDFASSAIEAARAKAEAARIRCRFLVADVIGDLSEITDTYDFAYDWHVLHHVYPEQRHTYVKNVARILNSRGRYLSVCFSEKNPNFGGSGKYRTTPLGTKLYFSSEHEMRELFEPCFDMEELGTIETEGKHTPHLSVYAFMRRR